MKIKLLMVIYLALIVIGYLLYTCAYKGAVKPGQVWVKTYDNNPFKPLRVDSIYILDVNGKYCKFRRVCYEGNKKTEYYDSYKIRLVRVISNKAKLNKN